MITRLELIKNRGRVQNEKSSYQPEGAEKDVYSLVMEDYRKSDLIMSKPYKEFNERSLLDRQSLDQKRFNSWQEPASQDPAESWKSNAVRPIARNKLISIAAHVTSKLIIPNIQAQNENDDEDKDAATVMRDLVEYRNEQADYEKSFLYSVIGAMVNPATIIHTEYSEIKRKIKEIKEDGTWTKKEITDEILSGFKDSIIPVDELFIENIYEHEIQKQGYLIWRRVISYDTAKQKYGSENNFKYVSKTGMQSLFCDDDDTFYDQDDEELNGNMVEEVNYYNRFEDLHLTFLNGVLVSDPEQPIRRNDKLYPFSKSGYELIDEGKFFYYKSLMFKMAPDEQVIERLYNMLIDGTFLQIMPPTALYGDEVIDSSVMVPGSVNMFQNEKTRLEPITSGANLSVGQSMLAKVEESLSETSTTSQLTGEGAGSQTKYETAVLEQNARTMLGLFSKMIGFLVKDLGRLYVGDVLQYMTVADVMDLSSNKGRLRFQSFAMPERQTDKGQKTRKLQFVNPADLQQEEESLKMEGFEGQGLDLKRSFDIMKEEGNTMDDKTEIYKINPELFRSLKFKIKISPDVVTPPTDAMKKAMNLEAYDRAISNPLANQEAIFRGLLLESYDKLKDDPDKYIMKQQQGQDLASVIGAGQGNGSPAGAVEKLQNQGIN